MKVYTVYKFGRSVMLRSVKSVWFSIHFHCLHVLVKNQFGHELEIDVNRIISILLSSVYIHVHIKQL